MIEAATLPEIAFSSWGRPRKAIIKPLRAAIDEWICEKCGAVGLQRDTHIHHKNLNPKDNAPGNLAMLCRKCHKEEHRIAGPSKRSSVIPLSAHRATKFKDRFDVRHGEKGGIKTLVRMVEKRATLADIGKHFGVTRECVRQWITFIDLKKKSGRHSLFFN